MNSNLFNIIIYSLKSVFQNLDQTKLNSLISRIPNNLLPQNMNQQK